VSISFEGEATGAATHPVGSLTLAAALNIGAGATDNTILVPIAGVQQGDIFATPSLSQPEPSLVPIVTEVSGGNARVLLWNADGASAINLAAGTEIRVAKVA